MKKFDVIINGAGMVGLAVAGLLAKNNFAVAVIEKGQLKSNQPTPQKSARVSTINQSAVALLKHLDAWQHIPQPSKSILNAMQVWDTTGGELVFDANNTGHDALGFVIENQAMVAALLTSLENHPNIHWFENTHPTAIKTNDNTLSLMLSDNTNLQTNVLVGADGANSWVRHQINPPMQERPYHQSAIIAIIRSAEPHQQTAYQKFSETGPIALLPLADRHLNALVWSADTLASNALYADPAEAFDQKLTIAFDYKLGKLQSVTEKKQFPLTMRHVDDYVQDHIALVGDAAHTIHPLAGQGVNLGYMDAACLAQTLIDAKAKGKPFYEKRFLRRYTRWRKADNTAMIFAMRFLKEFFGAQHTIINSARSFGVNALNQSDCAKAQFVRIAMGLSDDIPAFLQ